jgi:hypothetical protein
MHSGWIIALEAFASPSHLYLRPQDIRKSIHSVLEESPSIHSVSEESPSIATNALTIQVAHNGPQRSHRDGKHGLGPKRSQTLVSHPSVSDIGITPIGLRHPSILPSISPIAPTIQVIQRSKWPTSVSLKWRSFLHSCGQ